MKPKRSIKYRRKMRGHRIPVRGADLMRMSLDERVLLLGMWLATNELNALRKFVLVSDNTKTLGEVEAAARSAVTVSLVGVFALKSFEAFKFFKAASVFDGYRIYSQSRSELAQAQAKAEAFFENQSQASEMATEESETLRSDLLKKVRNKLSAHFDYEQIQKTCREMEEVDSFILLTEQQGNSLYFAATETAASTIARLGRKYGDLKSVIGRLVDEVHEGASLIGELTQEISISILDKHFGKQLVLDAPQEEFRAHDYRSLELPFFVDFGPHMKVSSRSRALK